MAKRKAQHTFEEVNTRSARRAIPQDDQLNFLSGISPLSSVNKKRSPGVRGLQSAKQSPPSAQPRFELESDATGPPSITYVAHRPDDGCDPLHVRQLLRTSLATGISPADRKRMGIACTMDCKTKIVVNGWGITYTIVHDKLDAFFFLHWRQQKECEALASNGANPSVDGALWAIRARYHDQLCTATRLFLDKMREASRTPCCMDGCASRQLFIELQDPEPVCREILGLGSPTTTIIQDVDFQSRLAARPGQSPYEPHAQSFPSPDESVRVAPQVAGSGPVERSLPSCLLTPSARKQSAANRAVTL